MGVLSIDAKVQIDDNAEFRQVSMKIQMSGTYICGAMAQFILYYLYFKYIVHYYTIWMFN